MPWFGSAAAYGEDPIKFFFDCKEKVCIRYCSTKCLLISMQYGNVFTFILMGRRVTVALTAAGNNFIMGGKHTAFSAEDVYTVSRTLNMFVFNLTRRAALDHSRLRQGRCLRLP